MTNWIEIRNDYEGSSDTLTVIAKRHDIPVGTLKSQMSRDKKIGEQWIKFATVYNDATEDKKAATVKEDEYLNIDTMKNEPRLIEIKNDDLNDRQRLFITYYVKCWNATKAYHKAYDCAYSTALSNGPQLLRNARIREEVIRLRDSLTADALLDRRMLIQKWMDIAFADITDYVDFKTEEIQVTDEQGNAIEYKTSIVNLNDSKKVDGTLITEVKKGKDGITIKLADKMKALEFLSKHMDLLNEDDKKHLQEEQMKLNIEKTKIEIATLDKGKVGDTNVTIVDSWEGE